MKKLLKNNVYWIGSIDWELDKFHGDDYSITHGSSQNAYLILEEKTVLIDTVWTPNTGTYLDNLRREIDIKAIDFIVINHGEVDHSGALPALLEEIPGTPIYCTANAVKSLVGQYHHPEWNFQVVKTGDRVPVGNGKELIFVEMRMLHWPDSMATYLTEDHILFSMDAFGQHFACGELFNDLADASVLNYEAMKYYSNIVQPFHAFVQRKLLEIAAMNLTIDMIAPSHGVIWRDNPQQIVEKYAAWCDDYQENQITIVYDSMWEGTRKLAHAIWKGISETDPLVTVKVLQAPRLNKNDIMLELFKSKAIAVGSPTAGNNILSSVAGLLHFLEELKFTGKKAACFGCYGWSGEGNKILRAQLEKSGFEILDDTLRCNWNPTEDVLAQAYQIGQKLAAVPMKAESLS